MLENDHFGGNWSFSSMSPRVAKVQGGSQGWLRKKCVTSWWGPHPIINIIALWQFWKVKSQNGFSDFSFSPVDPLTVDYQKGRDPGDWIWKRNAENNFTLILVFSQKNIPEYLFSKVVECLQQYHLGTQYIACIGLSRPRHMHAQHRIHTPHTNVKDYVNLGERKNMEWGDDCLITIIYHESWYVLVQFGFCLLRCGQRWWLWAAVRFKRLTFMSALEVHLRVG